MSESRPIKTKQLLLKLCIIGKRSLQPSVSVKSHFINSQIGNACMPRWNNSFVLYRLPQDAPIRNAHAIVYSRCKCPFSSSYCFHTYPAISLFAHVLSWVKWQIVWTWEMGSMSSGKDYCTLRTEILTI
eukprot:5913027-Amphidinium_carterae.1